MKSAGELLQDWARLAADCLRLAEHPDPATNDEFKRTLAIYDFLFEDDD
jgi:hypothetical protein